MSVQIARVRVPSLWRLKSRLATLAIVSIVTACGGGDAHGPAPTANTSLKALSDQVITGTAGDDTLAGGPGNDTIDGGPGTDIARYASPSERYLVTRVGGVWQVTDTSGAEGTDTLRGIERLQFADKTFELVNPAPDQVPTRGQSPTFLFDAVYYLLSQAQLVPVVSPAGAVKDYLTGGASAGRPPSAWFDAAHYRARWPDLAALSLPDAVLFQHFNLYGVWEGRSPGPRFDRFDGARYLADWPDVAAYVEANLAAFLGSRSNGAIAHYLIHGAREQRTAYDASGQPISLDYAVDLGSTSSVTGFTGNVLLGSPGTDKIRISIFSESQSGQAWIGYGTSAGRLDRLSAPLTVKAGVPLELPLDGLSANTQYHYRVRFSGDRGGSATPEYTFRTARPGGEGFVFTVQADSHLDENSDLNHYYQTLDNVLADRPDFHIDLGDTFMTEKNSVPLVANSGAAPDLATVIRRYRYERANYGRITHSVPLFLVNGNHDGELGWLRKSTPDTIPAWASTARLQYFLNPVPDTFYSGDSLRDAQLGQRAAWYSWQWGDALFVVLDPYWNSPTQPNQNGWNLTLGAAQYQWLSDTLASSAAKHKFVFLHNLVGGLDGQMRGGIEAAPYYEWGGRNADGTDGFAARRPGWAMPIHPLLVKNKVTAVFHGHDHVYVKQDLDGIVYQAVPQPSATNTANGPTIAKSYHYASGTILSSAGHLRVTVTPTAVVSEYVRSWLPAAQGSGRQNRQIDDRWSVPAR